MSKVLVVSLRKIDLEHDILAGPEQRCLDMALALKKRGHEVEIAEPDGTDKEKFYKDVKIINLTDKIFKNRIKPDVLVIPQGLFWSKYGNMFKKISKSNMHIVLDCYAPIMVEMLFYPSDYKTTHREYAHRIQKIAESFNIADLVLCASEKQKDYYFGMLNILGRVNFATYSDDLIIVVPTGVSPEELVKTKEVIRGKIADKNDKVILWAGGVYPWFDISRLIYAVGEIIKNTPSVKLVIAGGNNPISGWASRDGYAKARATAKFLNLLDTYVYFVDWQPYKERYSIYADSDVVVNVHQDNLENKYSYRTRLMDFIWAELPIITNAGNEVVKVLQNNNAAYVIDSCEMSDIKEAIMTLLGDAPRLREMKNNLKKLKKEFSWDVIIEPLHEFCVNPKFASDRISKHRK